MKMYTPILLMLMLLGGSLFAEENLTVAQPAKDLSGVVALTKGDVDLLTAAKIADYSYLIKDKNNTPLLSDTVKNKIDKAKNQMLDCGVYTCNYKVEVTADQNLAFDATTLKGLYEGTGVWVDSIFFMDLDKDNKSFENTDLTVPLERFETRTYIIRFEKDLWDRNVEIYHSIYGQERKDAASWNASGGTKTTIVENGLNYTIHTFTSSGVFAVNGTINATVLIVAGGGGGGGTIGGGGGGGGLIYNTSYSATGNITVTIGGGGAAGVGNGVGGTGENSVFGTLTAYGGGGGACHICNPTTGGSGGAVGGAYSGWSTTGADGISGQGRMGGNSTGSSSYDNSGAGGGGAGGAGNNTLTTGPAGNGGNGLNYSMNGTSVWYSGGGGGGVRVATNYAKGLGGYGGGGNGTNTTGPAQDGQTNKGGGGGGAEAGSAPENGGAGGSGIVIVKYLTNDGSYSVSFIDPTPDSGASIPGSLSINVSRSNETMNNCTAYINGTAYTMTVVANANLTCNLTQYLVNGTYTYYVFAKNNTNASRNATSEIRTITVDSSPPSNITFTTISTNGFYYLNKTVNISFISNNPKNCTLELNNTNYTMTLVNMTTCTYNIVNLFGNFTAHAFVSSNASLTGNSTPLSFFMFNQSLAVSNHSNPQYALYSTPLNLSVPLTNYFGLLTANVSYNTTQYAATCTQAQPYQCTATVQSPTVQTISNMPIVWTYSLINASLTYINTNATNATPSGMMYCGNYSNVTSLNISLIDEFTGAPVTGSFNVITTYAINPNIATTLTNTGSSFFSICIVPNDTMTIYTTITATATGYYGKTITSTYSVSNSMISQNIFMSNVSVAYPTILKVIRNPNIPMSGIGITVYKFTLPSTTEITVTGTTDDAGSLLAYLDPNVQLYVYNFSIGSENYTFGPEVLTCTGSTCYRTFTVGTAGSVPIDLTGSIIGTCSYSNITRIVRCIGNDTSNTLTSLTLLGNRLANVTPVCNTTVLGSSADISCTLPVTCGLYAVTFTGLDSDGGMHPLSGSTVMTTACSTTTGFGRDGWIAMFLLFGTIAMVGFFNIAVAMLFGAAALLIGLVLGLIPFDANFVVIISMTIFGAIIAYRIKV